jgi:hypothetical protein
MKAEHRKELQTNTLAQTLGQAFQGLKEGPSRSTVLILVVIGLGALLYFTWRYFATSAHENDSARWLQWDEVAAPGQLKAFLGEKDVADTTQARLARYLEARRRLLDGLQNLGFQRGRARDELTRAAEEYGKLAEETADRPLLHQEALLGAGRAREGLGDYGRAKELYRQLADKYPESARGRSAQAQLKRLEDPANAKDLQDLSTEFNTPPPTPPTGNP